MVIGSKVRQDLDKVQYLIVLFPDLCCLSYFVHIFMTLVALNLIGHQNLIISSSAPTDVFVVVPTQQKMAKF